MKRKTVRQSRSTPRTPIQAQGTWDGFISHASEDKPFATRLEKDLQSNGYSVWVDHANIRAGGLLIPDLMHALEGSKNIIVLWSKPASESTWVTTEWTAVVNRNHQEGPGAKMGVIPCILDDTPLAMFLLNYLFCDFRSSYSSGLSHLLPALGGPIAPTPGPEQWDPSNAVKDIASGQSHVLSLLSSNNPSKAAELQRKLNSAVESALQKSPRDHYILALAGYQKKNEYMIRHWKELQSGNRPKDVSLMEAMQFFFSALSTQPDDPSALNGLGSVFILRDDLDAAEFYVQRALDRSKTEPWPYEAAEHDLQLIRSLKAHRRSKT